MVLLKVAGQRKKVSNFITYTKPKRDFPSFNGDDVHKWLFRCNQYFKIVEMNDFEKLKQTSYYLDRRALHWH